MRNIPTPNRQAVAISPPGRGAQQNLVRPNRETDTTHQLSCDVVFGSPSANCLGTGICRITARTTVQAVQTGQKRTCQSTAALLFPIDKGKGLTMVLTRSLLCVKLYKNHLRHGVLRLDSPCPLPKDLRSTLGLKLRELPAGDYQVLESSGFIRVDFRQIK